MASCDVPANGHGVVLHEASCHIHSRRQAHANGSLHIHVPVRHPEWLLADSRLLQMMPADAPGPVPLHCFGMLSLERPRCAQGQVLVTGRDFAGSLG